MKLRLAFILALISAGIHLYLTFHFYDLQLGMISGDSICNLNSKFNCDAVSASVFSSIGGLPVSLLGLAANLGLAFLLFGWMIRWADDLVRIGAMNLILSSFLALTSVVMGVISTFLLNTYCIFCIALYLLSFAQFELIRRAQDLARRPLLDYLSETFTTARTYLVILLAIPLAAGFFHLMLKKKYGADKLSIVVRSSIAEWKGNPKQDFTVPPLFSVGPTDAPFVITEYADFRCPHCQSAQATIKAFLLTRTNVRLDFYAFPLDGACNEAMPGSEGISCYLAKSVLCAEKLAQKGNEMHASLFAAQQEVNAKANLEFTKEKVKLVAFAAGVPEGEMLSCIDESSTHEAIRAQAKSGTTAGISGTPAFFVNGRKLPRAQYLPVLTSAFETVEEKK